MQAQSKVTSEFFHLDPEWFSSIIDKIAEVIRCHELQLETNTAPDEVKRFYQAIKDNDVEELFHQNKLNAQKYFVKNIILEFAFEIKDLNIMKWAIDFNDSKIFTWIVIKDDDEEIETSLLLSEAKINAKYHKYGFDIVSTIVEESDNLPIPNHYNLVNLNQVEK